MLLGSFPTMKASLIVALLAVAVVAAAAVTIPMQKRPRLPLSAEHAEMLSRDGYVPLKGNIPNYGEFFIEFTVGTPPQRFAAQVDTGSSDLLINANGCSACGNGRKYNPAASSSAKAVSCAQFNCETCHSNQCGFDDRYGDGSEVSGPVYTDNLAFPGSTLKTTNVQLGAITRSTPNFEPSGVDGIMGLSYPVLSSWGGSPVPYQVAKQNNLKNVYSMCLGDNGGSITFGYNAPASTKWTPVTKKQWFVITVNDFTVDGKALGYSARDYADAIVDSGTTLLIMPDAPYNTLVSRVKAMCSSVNLPGVCNVQSGKSIFDGYCYRMTDAQIKSFPVLAALVPGWGQLTINPHNYIISAGQQSAYCWGIASGGSGMTILGDVATIGTNTIYDIDQNRIGMASNSTC